MRKGGHEVGGWRGRWVRELAACKMVEEGRQGNPGSQLEESLCKPRDCTTDGRIVWVRWEIQDGCRGLLSLQLCGKRVHTIQIRQGCCPLFP